jgi:hypothetical protein
MRLGFGEVEPNDCKDAVTDARDKFLICIENEAPQVLNDLWDSFSNSFLNISHEGTLISELTQWTHKWNLNASWVIEVAQNTLSAWTAFSEHIKNHSTSYKKWSPVGSSRQVNPIVNLQPLCGLIPWEAETVTRERYIGYVKQTIRQRIRKDSLFSHLSPKTKMAVVEELIKKFDNYCDQVLDAYLCQVDERGCQLWKLTNTKADFARNIDWAVNFQVLGESFNQIAMANEVEASTVKRAVEDTLRLIGLQKREARRGRPKGSKDSFESSRQSSKRSGLSD